MENPEIDPNKYSQLIFDKEAKGIQWSKDSLATNGVRLTGHPHAKENKSRHRHYIPFKKSS